MNSTPPAGTPSGPALPASPSPPPPSPAPRAVSILIPALAVLLACTIVTCGICTLLWWNRRIRDSLRRHLLGLERRRRRRGNYRPEDAVKITEDQITVLFEPAKWNEVKGLGKGPSYTPTVEARADSGYQGLDSWTTGQEDGVFSVSDRDPDLESLPDFGAAVSVDAPSIALSAVRVMARPHSFPGNVIHLNFAAGNTTCFPS